MRTDQIALQLWTVRDAIARDVPGTLQAIAAAGYGAVELAGLTATPTDDLATYLRDAGLRVAASHEGVEQLRGDIDGLAARLNALGCARLIVPWLPEDERRTRADVQRFAAELGEHAQRLATNGITLGYHNHAFEFAALDGTTVWDVLLDELPRDVEIEFDVYWAAVGGRDPVAEIRATADRIRLLHMKDRAAGLEPHDAPAGEGTFPFPDIVAAGRAVGVEWYVAEQDEPADALADIRRAYRYLASLAQDETLTADQGR